MRFILLGFAICSTVFAACSDKSSEPSIRWDSVPDMVAKWPIDAIAAAIDDDGWIYVVSNSDPLIHVYSQDGVERPSWAVVVNGDTLSARA
ncbi:MAG TPA: hypothetical protein VFX92_14285, partial [Candidatus Krumholzibacteria bacterium]|nr:hypothetical protein [Candidatus Krumholzibacteria bacterium]